MLMQVLLRAAADSFWLAGQENETFLVDCKCAVSSIMPFHRAESPLIKADLSVGV